MNGIRNALTMKDASQQLCKALLENDKFFLIPITSSTYNACFKVTGTTNELNFIKSLSNTHKMCYRILKYLFHSIMYLKTFFNSYLLKTFIIWHTSKRKCCNTPSKCLTDLLKLIAIALKLNDFNQDKYPQAEVVVQHLFIPGLVIEGETYDLTKDQVSQFLDVISKQLFKVGKSENKQPKEHLLSLKDTLKKLQDEWKTYSEQELLGVNPLALWSLI